MNDLCDIIKKIVLIVCVIWSVSLLISGVMYTEKILDQSSIFELAAIAVIIILGVITLGTLTMIVIKIENLLKSIRGKHERLM